MMKSSDNSWISPYELRGIEKGREEGRMEGLVEAKREAICRNARTLLGSVPQGLEVRLQETDSPEELDHLQDDTLRSYVRTGAASEPEK
jgi:hypothetical protein